MSAPKPESIARGALVLLSLLLLGTFPLLARGSANEPGRLVYTEETERRGQSRQRG